MILISRDREKEMEKRERDQLKFCETKDAATVWTEPERLSVPQLKTQMATKTYGLNP